MRTPGLRYVAVVVLLAAFLTVPAFGTTLTLVPDATSVLVGGTLNLNVSVDLVEYLYSYQLSLTYDAAFLKFLGVLPGTMYGDSPDKVVQGTSGSSAYVTGFQGLATGSVQGIQNVAGLLGTFSFEVLAPGAVTIFLSPYTPPPAQNSTILEYFNTSTNSPVIIPFSIAPIGGVTINASAVPEPGTAATLVCGLVLLVGINRRRVPRGGRRGPSLAR